MGPAPTDTPWSTARVAPIPASPFVPGTGFTLVRTPLPGHEGSEHSADGGGDHGQDCRAEDCHHGGHLHAFDVSGEQYGDRDVDDDVADENRRRLDSAVKSGIARFTCAYDFGDNWEHVVAIEKTLPAVQGQAYPACVSGKRNCPPEDCGGTCGYQEMLRILADPAHLERAGRIEWVGDEFEPEDFSVELADAGLAARFNRK